MSLPGELDPAAASLAWERWPLQEDPARLARLGLGGLLVALVGAVLVISLPLTAAVALGLALVSVLLPYLRPRRFLLTQEGLCVRQWFYTNRRTWPDFEAYQTVKGGYLLHIRPGMGPKPGRPNRFSPAARELFLPVPLEPEKALALEKVLNENIGERRIQNI